jgi:histidyl-tRNA synthetase
MTRDTMPADLSLANLAQYLTDITVAIDKLDKIGLEKVKEELQQRGLTTEQIPIIEQYLQISGSNEEKLAAIQSLLGHTETGKQGIKELETVHLQSQLSNLQFDFTLARGLNYYTGVIFEVKAKNVQMGSIGGGGRYDDLTGLFGVPNIPGVGISFGVDRIYDVLEELNLFPAGVHSGTKVLFFNLGEAESRQAFILLQQLRSRGIASELFHEPSKMDKQFKYAEKKGIPFVVILGDTELENGSCNLKNRLTGEQQTLNWDQLFGFDFEEK